MKLKWFLARTKPKAENSMQKWNSLEYIGAYEIVKRANGIVYVGGKARKIERVT